MREMEEELKRALQRTEPPDGFAERIMTRVSMAPRRRGWYLQYAAIAAAVIMAFAGGMTYQHHVERERAEDARRKLVFALHLTAEKLAAINHRLKVSSSTVRIEKSDREGL